MIPFELAVSGADRVGVEVKSPCKLARAGQALPGLKLAAKNAENDLGGELVANTDFVAAREPESHGVHGKPSLLFGELCDISLRSLRLNALPQRTLRIRKEREETPRMQALANLLNVVHCARMQACAALQSLQ